SEQMLGRAGVWRISVFEPPPSQTPNPKLQRNPGIETPKTKLQTPKKSQDPSSKPRPALRAWNLELGASLVSGAWCLVFGITPSPQRFIASTTEMRINAAPSE